MASRHHIFKRRSGSLSRLLLLCVFAFLMVLVSTRTTYFSPVRSYLLDLIAPLYQVTNVPQQITDWGNRSLLSRDELLDQIVRLENENLILQGRASTMAATLAENTRLRQLLSASELLQARVLITELVGSPPDNETHRIIINRGSRDKVRQGLPVIDETGLIGQVTHVGVDNSEVLMISDRTHAVPVYILRNGSRAIAEGTGDSGLLHLRNVPPTMDVKVGDKVVTSGLGERFPQGYPVGEVISVEQKNALPFMEVVVQPSGGLETSRHMLLLFSEQTSLNPFSESVNND